MGELDLIYTKALFLRINTNIILLDFKLFAIIFGSNKRWSYFKFLEK